MVNDAVALLSSLVTKEKVTVMGERMGVSMMVTGGARAAWSAAAITARSLGLTIIRRMIAVKDQQKKFNKKLQIFGI